VARIILIEDDEALRPMLVKMIERLGHEVRSEPDGKAGLGQVRVWAADLVITDMIMPGQEGAETIFKLRREFPGIHIIAMSGGGRLGGADYLALAKKLGVDTTLAKPFSRDELKFALDTALGNTAPAQD
jgi:CheY-like chemotaxis protein